MCFSVNVNLVKEEIEDRYGINFPDKYRYEPSYYYHAFGLPELPAICSEDPGNVKLLRWGLIPSWVRSMEQADEIRLKTFNARAETISSKHSYSASFKSKRCIIPVKGFFEWQHAGKSKIPWYIYCLNEDVFSIAGLYSDWVQTDTGQPLRTFSIITTEANELMAEVHNSKKRMPAILSRENEKKWIDLSLSPNELSSLLSPYPAELLKAHTISQLVNSRTDNRNTPDVIKPYSYGSDRLF